MLLFYFLGNLFFASKNRIKKNTTKNYKKKVHMKYHGKKCLNLNDFFW